MIGVTLVQIVFQHDVLFRPGLRIGMEGEDVEAVAAAVLVTGCFDPVGVGVDHAAKDNRLGPVAAAYGLSPLLQYLVILLRRAVPPLPHVFLIVNFVGEDVLLAGQGTGKA